MNSGSRPIVRPPHTAAPATAIFSPVLGSCGPFCSHRETELPVPDVCLARSRISPPGDFKPCPPRTATAHILARVRHSPDTTATMGVMSYPPAPRRMWEPTQEGEVTDFRSRRKKCSSAQLYPAFLNLKTCWFCYENQEETMTGSSR